MLEDTKADILNNSFLSCLRMELIVDEAEYEKLCASLKRLALEWRGLTEVDKELMQDLYVLAAVIRNISPDIRGETSRVDEMATEIDGLVMDCLA